MTHRNLAIIDAFFRAFVAHDKVALAEVTSDDLTWYFPGRHPLSGTKRGREEVVDFFSQMGRMGFKAEKLISGANDSYVVETQWVTGAVNGDEVTMGWTVLWKFHDGKLESGRHYSADQYLADHYFTRVLADAEHRGTNRST
jgi:ketosteroid isomerase-like protein